MMLDFPKHKACCFTGHRKLPGDKLPDIVSKLNVEIDMMMSRGVNHFVAGGALGFDTLAALTVISIRERAHDIHLHLMLPCPDQTRRWKTRDVEIYNHILSLANSSVFLCDHYHPGVMQMRNRAMVDASDNCICYWNKDTVTDEKIGGGTLYTVNYARKKGINTVNLWDAPPQDSQLTFDITG